MTVIHTGALEYRGDNGLRGRESWTITEADDRTLTLSAQLRMFDTRVERWVVQTVDADMRPLRSYVSQRIAGEFLGEGWFTFKESQLVGRSSLRDLGRVDQEVTIVGELDYFVPHAVAGDSWITACYDMAAGGWQEVRNGFTTSLLADGSTGPLIEQHRGIRQCWLGTEDVTVPAGTYRTHHFVVSARPGIEEHLWVSTDHLRMLVKLRSDRLATTYVLTEYDAVDAWS